MNDQKVLVWEQNGVRTVSRLGSYITWLNHSKDGHLPPTPLDENGVCRICGGSENIYDPKVGSIWCLCQLNREEALLRQELEPYRSAYTPKTLDEFAPWGDPRHQRLYRDAREIIRKWQEWPMEWMTIIGPQGTGKSHLLTALAQRFGTWALYTTAADFEQNVWDNFHADTLNDMIEVVRRAPILLYDDLGSEFISADERKNFVRSTLRKIIDFRYQRWQEFPVVITTNLGPSDLDAYDRRLSDRIQDASKVNLIAFDGPSWRRNANAQ